MREIKVLIVDEEPEFTSILVDRLCSWGFAATAANSREEVLESLTAFRPEVVVLGLQDRNTKGLDILRMIKARLSGHSPCRQGCRHRRDAGNRTGRGGLSFLAD